jgi:hypothetical protein
MDETRLLSALEGLYAERGQGAWLPAPGCLSLPRLRQGLLDPLAWTEEERRHLHERGCPSCRRAEARIQEELWHPERLDLFLSAAGLAAPSAWVALHLEADRCRRCLGALGWMKRAPSLREVAEGLRRDFQGGLAAARSALERVALSARPLALGAASTLESWSTRRPDAVFQQISLGEDLLATLRDDEAADARLHLHLDLETRSRELAGRRLRYHFFGAEGEDLVEGRVTMGAAGLEGWVSGSADLGLLDPLRQKLSEPCYLVVAPEGLP